MTQLDLNRGAMAPVSDEIDIPAPAVTGTIPPLLDGTLIRNGPNPFSGRFTGNDVLSWWPGPAMLHGISFSGGRASGYRNRWVRTQAWGEHRGEPAGETLVASNPNVNVLQHAGEIMALAEGGPPVAINAGLETLGAPAAHGSLAGGTTAHPKLDPATGELLTFRSHWSEPWLTYAVIDAHGRQTDGREIAVPGPSMMHDMAITESHSVLLDLNVGYDFSMLQRGHRMPIRWRDDRTSRLCVVPRRGGPERWFDIEPCFIQHVVNAYDEGRSIVLDAVRYPWYLKLDAADGSLTPNPLGVLWRYVIDLDSGTVAEHQHSELNVELPRINESFTGRRHRYVYAVEQPTDVEMRGIVRYDLHTGGVQRHSVEPGDQNSEPVFVANPGADSEDDGWLLVCVYRQATDTCEVRILDPADLSSPPVATVHLGRRIPAGFHGAWISRDG